MTDAFRILVIVFLALHGIAHVIWFLAAWTPLRSGVRDGPWMLPGDVTIRSPLGRLLGSLALLTIVVLAGAAVLLLAGSPAWRSTANAGAVLSFISVFPWLRQSPGTTAQTAIIADLVLLFLLALPLSVELTPVA